MTFKEWLESLQPQRQHTAGEDIADSIALAIIMILIYLVILL